MTPQPYGQTVFPYRFARRFAVASGITGILALCCLISFLVLRGRYWDTAVFMLRMHDIGVIIQFTLLVPVVWGLRKLLTQNSLEMGNALFSTGIAALAFTVLLLLLGIIKFVSDGLYTLPQGVFGVWLIIVNWRMKGIGPAMFRWFGILVGCGLALVGTFCVGYAIFVDTLILHIPAATIQEISKIPTDTPANNIMHLIIFIGTPMGVLTLPFWTILAGSILFREKPQKNN